MASTIPKRFSPQALARPSTRNPNKPLLKKLPSKSHLNPNNQRNRRRKFPPPSLSTSGGGRDSTTYTRLPPRDYFILPSFDSPPHSSAVAKLSDFDVAAPTTSGDVIESKDDELGSNLGFDYGKFELFEVNSDSEEDEEEEDDYDYDYDYDLKLIGLVPTIFWSRLILDVFLLFFLIRYYIGGQIFGRPKVVKKVNKRREAS